MTKPVSQMVADMEQELRTLRYENENLKIMLYRMIASNDRGVELVPYSDTKAKRIKACEFYMNENVPHIGVKHMNRYNVEPNNSENEI